MRSTAMRFPALLVLALACAGNAQEYSDEGADDCVVCHGAGMPKSAVQIFHTPHGSPHNPDSPFAQKQCESCHGPSAGHAASMSAGGNELPPMIFGEHSESSATDLNDVCLGCHESHGRLGWFGSAHEGEELQCTSCHQVHVERDPMLDKEAQQETCFTCHQNRQADVLKASTHPLRFGSMTCSDCHDPHNGDNDYLLTEATVNDTCFTCHAEKRGPYLWEHAPASEDCSLCHNVHGSNHPALLTRRPPLLCQQCHSAAGHPSTAFTGEDINDDFNNRFLLSRSCLNCHSQVHGSNHPSGSSLHR